MNAYELSRLDTSTFEQLANMLVLRVLGMGATGFGPGADGGRDGWFEGEAPYPSESERWSGVWYIQSKFHKPHLSKDPQKWLLQRIAEELALFSDPASDRHFPDNWIVVTNIDPTGKPETGSFDKARAMVEEAFPGRSNHFHIWGGSKIIGLLTAYPSIANYYADAVTPGHVISSIYRKIIDANASEESIIRDLVVTRFDDNQYTKLDQAGSDSDNRPGIHILYTDLPYHSPNASIRGMVAVDLSYACSLNYDQDFKLPSTDAWQKWQRNPKRNRVWFIKGGPGQGKSTSTQFLSQIHRAAIILGPGGPNVTSKQRDRAEEIKKRAVSDDIWPLVPRVPVSIELRLFAQWFGERSTSQSKRIITYLAEQLTKSIAQDVGVSELKRSISTGRWLFVFDGLDEVPGDVKDSVASEVNNFTNNWLIELNADAMVVCTSRPQGYSGQFDDLEHATINLSRLSVEQALACARPVLEIGRSTAESADSIKILEEAVESTSIREIMTSPLQSHIMAVVVRSGGRPPERKWQLFYNFYEVIKKREANRTLPNPLLADVLRRDKLLKGLHARLGFELHSRAETSVGATTSLLKDEFKILVKDVVESLQDDEIEKTINIVMEATTERLVLVNTPENGNKVRFDIRPLQEFFAAEYLYETGDPQDLKDKLTLLARDSHWREVLHFYISGLIERNRKPEIATVIEVLQEVNGRAFGEDSRLLSMRLALGAIQTTRVIEEGVLEDDRRVRADFEHCVAELCGCADALKITTGIQPPRSRTWLKRLFFNALKERAESEALGAVILLSQMVDNLDEATEVLRYLDSGSRQLQRFVLLTFASEIYPWNGGLTPPIWLRSWALRMVTSPIWRELGEACEAAFSIISPRDDLSDEVITEAGLPLTLAPALRAIFKGDRYASPRTGSLEIVEVDLAGLGTLNLAETQLSADSKSWNAQLWTAFSTATGALRGSYLILAAHNNINEVKREDVIEWSENDPAALELLPYALSPFRRKYLTQVSSFDTELERVSSQYPGYSLSIRLEEELSSANWAEGFKHFPSLTSHLLFDRGEVPLSAEAFLKSDESKDIITSFLQNGHGDDALTNVLSVLDEHSPHHNAIRPLVMERSKQFQKQKYVPFQRKCYISLPEDIAILPYILNLIASDSINLMEERDATNAVGDRIRREMKERYDLNAHELGAIALEKSGNNAQNLAVEALHLFANEDFAITARNASKILDIDWNEQADTVANIIMLALSDGVMAGHEQSCAVASAILDRTRENYELRIGFSPLLRRWRERTASPVNDSLSKLAWH